ncbi:MAG: hypothetical protein NXI32_16420 [bacterium]|nr:hypothetical protein [bacterium]
MRTLPLPEYTGFEIWRGRPGLQAEFAAITWCRCLLSSPWSLLACKLIIGLVSAYDIFLTIKYVESLPWMELNPVGRWLMQLDSGPECALDQIACFVAAKFSGNFLTLAAIELLCHWKRNVASLVAVGVAAAQLLLLYFLTTG